MTPAAGTSGRIRRLPDELVSQIAAGEVVERPASVVKELVENSLDAGARTVRVDVEAGGKALVRVADDGHGMSPEDARLALERHATSKLRQMEDLQRITTHGFRGEALPSIASVSHLVLRTRDDSGPAGAEIEVRDGRLLHVRETGHPRGTTVEVRDLFGGVPARRKFLRSDATEASHLSEALLLLALARPSTGFVLTSAGRALIQAPAVQGLADRVYQLFGAELLDELAPVEGGREWAAVRGFVSRPDLAGARRPTLRLFVNGRAVRDRALARAVAEGYRAAGAGEQRGDSLLFLDVPAHLVDVNVHPAKAEVRFADARVPWSAVQGAVEGALSRAARAAAPRADTARIGPAGEPGLAGGGPARPAPRAGAATVAEGHDATLPVAPLVQRPDDAVALPLQALGQHRNTYVVCSDGEDLVLVDQHTAHERVRFEALQARADGRTTESQMLLAPVVFTPVPALRPVLEASAVALAAVGYDVEPFGGGAFRVRAVPAVLPAADPAQALQEVLADLLAREEGEWAVNGVERRLAATVACHSAVRAGQPLAPEAMRALVRDLTRAAQPTLCPHGRPTLVRIPRGEVSRWFGRAGWRRS